RRVEMRGEIALVQPLAQRALAGEDLVLERARDPRSEGAVNRLLDSGGHGDPCSPPAGARTGRRFRSPRNPATATGYSSATAESRSMLSAIGRSTKTDHSPPLTIRLRRRFSSR